MDLKEIEWKVLDCTDLALDSDNWRALVNRGNKYFCSTKCGEILGYLRKY